MKDSYEHPLQEIFDLAIEQVTKGKGERHGGEATPFMEQPWVHYAQMHGRGFLTGQAAKKLEEAASTRNGEQFTQEVLGAIVYAAMAIIHEKSFTRKLEEVGKFVEQVPGTRPGPRVFMAGDDW